MFKKFKNLAYLTLGLFLAGSPSGLSALPQNQNSVVFTVEESNLEGIIDPQYQFYVNFENKTYKLPKENNASFYINGEIMGKVNYIHFSEVSSEAFILNYDVQKEAQLIASGAKFVKKFDMGGGGNAFVETDNPFSRIYLGQLNFSTGVFKNNPTDATEYYYIIGDLGFYSVVSFPRSGGFIYLDTEKTNYTIDILGTIRFNSFDNNKIVGFTLPFTGFNKLLNTNGREVYLDSVLRDYNLSLHSSTYESDFVYIDFHRWDNKLNTLAFSYNFGDGQVFEVKGLKEAKPVFESTPYRVSADGIIGDSREMIKLPNGLLIPKPVARIKFGYAYPFNNDDNISGIRISKEALSTNLF